MKTKRENRSKGLVLMSILLLTATSMPMNVSAEQPCDDNCMDPLEETVELLCSLVNSSEHARNRAPACDAAASQSSSSGGSGIIKTDGIIEIVGGGGGAGMAGSFSAGCYTHLIAPPPYTQYWAVGCAGAAAYSAHAFHDFKFAKEEWTFELGASAAGCGSMVAGSLGVLPHVNCQGYATAGEVEPEFACAAVGSRLTSYGEVCAGGGASVADDQCAESESSAHASNMIAGVEMTEAAAQGSSGGCAPDSDAALQILSLSSSSNGQQFDTEELPPVIIQKLKDDLVNQLYESVDTKVEDGAYSTLAGLSLLGSVVQLEQAIIDMEVATVTGYLLE